MNSSAVARRKVSCITPLLLLAIFAAASAPAYAVVCRNQVTPYQAYAKAIQRGWIFYCRNQSNNLVALLPVYNTEVRCVYKTPRIWLGSLYTSVLFFRSGATERGNGRLKNGWKIRNFELNYQHERDEGGGPGGGHFALYAKVPHSRKNYTYTIRLTRIDFENPNRSSCSNLLEEAF